MTTSLIERMARAMWENVGLFDPDLDTMRACARAALIAAREPSEEMVEAYWDKCDVGGDLIDDRREHGEHYEEGGHIKRVWAAMIDKALEEGS